MISKRILCYTFYIERIAWLPRHLRVCSLRHVFFLFIFCCIAAAAAAVTQNWRIEAAITLTIYIIYFCLSVYSGKKGDGVGVFPLTCLGHAWPNWFALGSLKINGLPMMQGRGTGTDPETQLWLITALWRPTARLSLPLHCVPSVHCSQLN